MRKSKSPECQSDCAANTARERSHPFLVRGAEKGVTCAGVCSVISRSLRDVRTDSWEHTWSSFADGFKWPSEDRLSVAAKRAV